MKVLHSFVVGLGLTSSMLAPRITFPVLIGTGLMLMEPCEATHPTTTAGWHQAGFDSAHSAYNRFETVLTPSNVGQLTQVWASQVDRLILYASPVVSGGRVFIGSGEGRMYAFDAATGATLWIGERQDSFFVDSAAVQQGLVFANSLYGTLLAYNAGTGKIVWTSDLTDVRASPTLHGQLLYVASFDGTLTALDPLTATPVWTVPGKCCVFDQAPTVDHGRVFQMRTDHTLIAYEARTGTQLWSKAYFSIGTQAASNGTLFFADPPDVVAVDEATGDERWRAFNLSALTTAAPAVGNGLVFVTASALYALDITTGAVVWIALAASSWGPTVANGVVFASSQSGEWDAFDERDGSLLWSVTVGSGCGGDCTNTVPVIANGMLYLAGPDQYLRAFALPTQVNHTGPLAHQAK